MENNIRNLDNNSYGCGRYNLKNYFDKYLSLLWQILLLQIPATTVTDTYYNFDKTMEQH